MTFRAISTGAAAAMLALSLSTSQAQILVTQDDVAAEMRVQWMSMKRDMPQHPSQRVQRFAQCIAYAIIDVIPEEFQNLNWEIIVFDSEAANAMVTLEGKIAVFSGIFDAAYSADRLAAVIGHEVAHLTEEHVKQRVRRGVGTGLIGGIGRTITGIDGQSAASVVMQLPFQREQENEADFVGMRYAAMAGYNPAATIELWREMAGDTSRPKQPEWLSTHPDPELRMRDIAGQLAPALVLYNEALDAGVRPSCVL